MEHFPEVHTKVVEAARLRRPIYTMQNCLRAVCSVYGVTPKDIHSRSRRVEFVLPRQHFCWVVYRNRLDISYPMIGRFLGKDHTTIVHAVEKFEQNKWKWAARVMQVDELIHSLSK